jgi:hypothetical protein
MSVDVLQAKNNPVAEKYVKGLAGKDLLVSLTWDEWLKFGAPYEERPYTTKEATTRFNRNGYDWDIHGTMYLPEKESVPGLAFIVCHGNLGSESFMDRTPDGRPSFSRILASQGIPNIAITYPGHHAPPDGVWRDDIKTRQPVYLFDKKISMEETLHRNLACTWNTIVQGVAQLSDQVFPGRKVCLTSGPMGIFFHKFSKKTKTVGITTYGHGGPDGWRLQWREQTGADESEMFPIGEVYRRSPEGMRHSGYENVNKDLTPWGGADEFIDWSEKVRSNIKSCVNINQHAGNIDILKETAKKAGLPEEEYIGYFNEEPDPKWAKDVGVLLTVGERDKRHWISGDKLEDKREYFMGLKYRNAGFPTHTVLVPKLGHAGYAEMHNEGVPYCWLWGVKSGFIKV